MNPREFFFNPADYGIPTRDELVSYRIWDSHFHGFYTAGNPLEQFHRNNFYVERMGVERSVSLEIGGTLSNPLVPTKYDDEIRRILETQNDRFLGITPIEPGFPAESVANTSRFTAPGT